MSTIRAKHVHAHVHNPDILKPILKAANAILAYSFAINGKQASPLMLRRKLNPAYAVMAKVLSQLFDKEFLPANLTRLYIEIAATEGIAKVFVSHKKDKETPEQNFNVLFINQDQKNFMRRHLEKKEEASWERLANGSEFYSLL